MQIKICIRGDVMSKTVIDTGVTTEAVEKLKKLKSEVAENRKKKKPVSSKNKGSVHKSICNACELLDKEWDGLEQLLAKSIDFLLGASVAYDESDKQNAAKVKQ